MTSVDLAFHRFWERAGLNAQVDYCQLYRWEEGQNRQSQEGEDGAQPFVYRCFRDDLDAVYGSDAIVFWGDFLHAYRYQDGVAGILIDKGIAQDTHQARELIHRHFFLKDAPDEVLKKVLVYGGTMITNHPSDYTDASYTQQLSRFMGLARRVWMREIYSAFKVGHLRHDYTTAHLGTDCSLLLRPDDVDRLPRGPWSEDSDASKGKIGVFFGRSACPPKLLGVLARDLSRQLQAEVEWLPWGDTSAFADCRKAVQRACPKMAVHSGVGSPSMGDLLALLRRYRCVVSDTYHVCVNAWRMKVPAVCVGQAVSKTANNINSGKAFAWRDKRQVFYSMYDAMPFYTYVEELTDRSWRPRRIWQLSQLLADQALIDATVNRIHHHRDLAEKQLAKELTDMTHPHAARS